MALPTPRLRDSDIHPALTPLTYTPIMTSFAQHPDTATPSTPHFVVQDPHNQRYVPAQYDHQPISSHQQFAPQTQPYPVQTNITSSRASHISQNNNQQRYMPASVPPTLRYLPTDHRRVGLIMVNSSDLCWIRDTVNQASGLLEPIDRLVQQTLIDLKTQPSRISRLVRTDLIVLTTVRRTSPRIAERREI